MKKRWPVFFTCQRSERWLHMHIWTSHDHQTVVGLCRPVLRGHQGFPETPGHFKVAFPRWPNATLMITQRSQPRLKVRNTFAGFCCGCSRVNRDQNVWGKFPAPSEELRQTWRLKQVQPATTKEDGVLCVFTMIDDNSSCTFTAGATGLLTAFGACGLR